MNSIYIRSMVFLLLVPLGCSRNIPDAAKAGAERGNQEVTNVPDRATVGQLAPPVELSAGDLADHRFYVIMHAGPWAGRPFREIVEPHDIKRIIRVYDNGFASNDGEDTQRRYDRLVSHLIQSEEKARDWGLWATETNVATLVVVCNGGEAYMVEVLADLGGQVSAINISGAGKGARIDVKGGSTLAPRPIGSREKPFGRPPVTGHEY